MVEHGENDLDNFLVLGVAYRRKQNCHFYGVRTHFYFCGGNDYVSQQSRAVNAFTRVRAIRLLG